MTGPTPDATERNLAPAKVHLVGTEPAIDAKWSRRRTLLFIVFSSVILWGLIGFGLWLVL